MIKPELNEVLKLSKIYNVIPVYGETLADLETPLSAYMKIDKPENSFLLESIEGGEKTARYSFLSRDPYEIFSYKDGSVTRESRDGKKTHTQTKDPLGMLKKIFADFKCAPVRGIPHFTGGAVGYIGYDVIKLYEKVPHDNKTDTFGWPDIYLMFNDVLMVFDHVYHKIQIVVNIMAAGDSAAEIKNKYRKACETIGNITADLRKPRKVEKYAKVKAGTIKHFTKPADFKATVKKVVGLIKHGEAIQVVPSQRFGASFSGDPLLIYRSLRTINPSPYMHYLHMKDKVIIGASPELMVRVDNRTAEVRPIAGTRRRGKTEEEDKMLEKELISDEKERAEHVMLVDLGRNDLGRVCETGSVKVDSMMFIERYSHVMHIVSSVTGKLKSGTDCFDVFKATFPAGTVSGAPKVMAMQIIDSVERYKRGPYSGAVGIISFSGAMETCISIRTIYYSDGKVAMQAGGGVVADSKPDFEYKETLSKAKAVFEAVRKASSMFNDRCSK